MYPDLNGKTAVVTGAASGLGEGIAARFLEEGMNVVVNYHSDARKENACKLAAAYNKQETGYGCNIETIPADDVPWEDAQNELQRCKKALDDAARGKRAVVVQADVSTEEGVRALSEAAIENFGGIDVWVNNAGIESRYETHELPLEVWNKTLAVNLTGVFLGSREALAYFVGKGKQGVIINMSSVHEKIPWPTFAAYSASKGGIKLFTQTIALEYAKRGIRCNCIAPGAIETPINAIKFDDPEARALTETMIPADYIGQVNHIADAAAWLASDSSAYVTGQSIFVDGGMSLYPSFERGDG